MSKRVNGKPRIVDQKYLGTIDAIIKRADGAKPQKPKHTVIYEAGGIAVAPHPSVFYKSPPSRQINSYDAIEVMNASSIPFQVFTYLSKRFAARLDLPQTAGSDSHYAPEIGAAYTIVDADPDVDEIVAAIKKGATIPRGKAIPWKIRVERTALKLKRKI